MQTAPDKQRVLDEIKNREMWTKAQKWDPVLALDLGGGVKAKTFALWQNKLASLTYID